MTICSDASLSTIIEKGSCLFLLHSADNTTPCAWSSSVCLLSSFPRVASQVSACWCLVIFHFLLCWVKWYLTLCQNCNKIRLPLGFWFLAVCCIVTGRCGELLHIRIEDCLGIILTSFCHCCYSMNFIDTELRLAPSSLNLLVDAVMAVFPENWT